MDSILRHHRSQAQLFADNPDQLIPVDRFGQIQVATAHYRHLHIHQNAVILTFACHFCTLEAIRRNVDRNLQLEVTPHPRAIQILLFSDRPHKIN